MKSWMTWRSISMKVAIFSAFFRSRWDSKQNLRSPRRNHRRSKQVARSFLSGGSASFRLKFSRCCLYGGIDLHANNSVVVLLNEQDQVIYQKRLPNHLPVILEPLSLHHREIEGVVVESTYNWYWLVDGLMEAGYRVHLATRPPCSSTMV